LCEGWDGQVTGLRLAFRVRPAPPRPSLRPKGQGPQCQLRRQSARGKEGRCAPPSRAPLRSLFQPPTNQDCRTNRNTTIAAHLQLELPAEERYSIPLLDRQQSRNTEPSSHAAIPPYQGKHSGCVVLSTIPLSVAGVLQIWRVSISTEDETITKRNGTPLPPGIMASDLDETTLQTITLLEARLMRIEHHLYGHTTPPQNKATATRSLRELEYRFRKITHDIHVYNELLKICKRTIMPLGRYLTTAAQY